MVLALILAWISDYIQPNRQWNESLLATLFSANMMTTITSVPIAQESMSDQLVWEACN